jgi:hypothetical protein
MLQKTFLGSMPKSYGGLVMAQMNWVGIFHVIKSLVGKRNQKKCKII